MPFLSKGVYTWLRERCLIGGEGVVEVVVIWQRYRSTKVGCYGRGSCRPAIVTNIRWSIGQGTGRITPEASGVWEDPWVGGGFRHGVP